MTQPQSTLMKLNKDYPSTSMKSLAMLQPYEDLGHYSHSYMECAERLFSTYQARPEDDQVLLPFLNLYRQAYELLFKDLALCLASHQRRLGNLDARYTHAKMLETIGHKGFGHSLMKSHRWVEQAVEDLGLGHEPMPPQLRKAVDLLHNLDPSGTTFRYPDDDLGDVLRIDIIKLRQDLQDGIHWLWAVYDWADESLKAVPSASEYT